MTDQAGLITVILVTLPFVKNKLLPIAFILAFPLFYPASWQWYLTLYIATIVLDGTVPK